MKSKEELDKMTKTELVDYLLNVSEDPNEPCIIREAARCKAVQLL